MGEQALSRDARPGVGGYGPGAAGQAGRAGTVERPHVRCEPSVRFGYPHIRGIATDAIAGMVSAGEGVDGTAVDYGLTRGEVLVACWFEAVHGRPRTGYRRAWAEWAKAAGDAMWHSTVDYARVPDPPSRTCGHQWLPEVGDDAPHRCLESRGHARPHRCECRATEEVTGHVGTAA